MRHDGTRVHAEEEEVEEEAPTGYAGPLALRVLVHPRHPIRLSGSDPILPAHPHPVSRSEPDYIPEVPVPENRPCAA